MKNWENNGKSGEKEEIIGNTRMGVGMEDYKWTIG